MLTPGVIELTVRNDGPDAVTVAQAQVNDAFVQFTRRRRRRSAAWTAATVRLQQPWVEGEAYEVVLLTSTGGDDRARDRRRGRDARRRRLASSALMALLGIYVGVIPIALGMLWLPWVRRDPAGVAAGR